MYVLPNKAVNIGGLEKLGYPGAFGIFIRIDYSSHLCLLALRQAWSATRASIVVLDNKSIDNILVAVEHSVLNIDFRAFKPFVRIHEPPGYDSEHWTAVYKACPIHELQTRAARLAKGTREHKKPPSHTLD